MELTHFPGISEQNGAYENIDQIVRYLYRLNDRLSEILGNLSEENLSQSLRENMLSTEFKSSTEQTVKDLRENIIRTATEVRAVRDSINLTLQNNYVAKSEIGSYTEQAVMDMEIDGKGITQYFHEIRQLEDKVDDSIGELESENNLTKVKVSELTAYIKTGKLEDDVYGVEIGNVSETGQSNTPFKVRLSDNRLSFYISDSEVAYFSDNAMYISKAEVLDNIRLGDCIMKNHNGLSLICL